MLQLRRHKRRGQDWNGPELGIPARTASAILRRHQVPCLRECDPLTGEVIRASKAASVRYERDRPGELVHADVKRVGRIPDGGGWRARGRSEEVRGRGIGYDFVHSMVDDHSRLAYSEILPDEKSPTCATFLLRAADYFADHGIDRIERVISDNQLRLPLPCSLEGSRGLSRGRGLAHSGCRHRAGRHWSLRPLRAQRTHRPSLPRPVRHEGCRRLQDPAAIAE